MRRHDPTEIQHILRQVEKIVRQVGMGVLDYKKKGNPLPYDTGTTRGHEESSIDDFARHLMQRALDEHLPHLEGVIRFELRPYNKTFLEPPPRGYRYALIIDEIEGTTNTKRCMASPLDYTPQAGVSLAVSMSERLEDLVIGAFHAMNSNTTYSAIITEGNNFMTFLDGKRIDPEVVTKTQGDSRTRVIVAGYSNSHRLKKGELEQALWDNRFKPYEGCRASGVDLISIIRNQFDAYIDVRQTWSTLDAQGIEQEAQLQCYDIAGMLPIVKGCGLVVEDPTGRDWRTYGLLDAMPLVIARPEIHTEIMNIVAPLAKAWHQQAEKQRKKFHTKEAANGNGGAKKSTKTQRR